LTLVFWDIDGTLLTTGRAGIFAWQDALREIAGVEVDLDSFDTAGHPDFGIARRLLTEYGGVSEPDPAIVRRLVNRYEDLLPAALHRRAGRVLPNVREILESLASTPDVWSLLLTGNTRRGARAKLEHYGLSEFLRGGAFSDAEGDRSMIARAALESAATSGCSPAPNGVLVVGDTPHDVRCAGAIGARAVGVATGGYDVAALEAAGAWRVFAQLPSAAEFLALLEEQGAPANG
jgi:phosphoglycolate phosphatase